MLFQKKAREGTSVLPGSVGPSESESPKPEYVPGEVLIKLRPNVPVLKFEKSLKVADIKNDDEFLIFLQTQGVASIEKIVSSQKELIQEQSTGDKTVKDDVALLYKLKLEEKNELDVLRSVEEFKKSGFVEEASPNYFRFASYIPNDPLFPQQWGLEQDNNQDIDAPQAWEITRGSEGVVVAVIDTGIYAAHPDLENRIFLNLGETGLDTHGRDKKTNGVDDDGNGFVDDFQGWDTTQCQEWDLLKGECLVGKNPGPNTTDDAGHGTHVAGIIGAVTDNNQGIAGIDWEAQLLPVKVLNFQGAGTCEDVINGIYYATSFADVMNFSLGSSGFPCTGEEDTINYAINSGVVVIAAAGNNNSTMKSYPAGFDSVMAIAALDENGDKASFSNYGGWIDVTAPGVNILSTIVPGILNGCSDEDNDGYALCSGTSMATPFVSGIAGLILSQNHTLKPLEVRNIIINGATDVLTPGKDIYTGYGLVNANRAILEMDTTPPPRVTISIPYDEMPIGEILKIEGSANVTNFDHYEVDFAPENEPNNWQTTEVTLVDPKSPIENGVLAIWNTQDLSKGRYILRLKVFTGDKAFETTKIVILDKQITGAWPHKLIEPGLIVTADVNNDGLQEIVIQEKDKLNVLDKFGQSISDSWPINITASGYSYYSANPTVGNLDDNPSHPGKEIIYSIPQPRQYPEHSVNTIYAVYSDGSPLPAWPQTVPGPGSYHNNQPLADIDGDGFDEVIYLTYGGDTYNGSGNAILLQVRDGNGELLPGWENVIIDDYFSVGFGSTSMPVVGNLNTDPHQEIVVSMYEGQWPNGVGKIKAYASSGEQLWEFSLPSGPDIEIHEIYLALGDINGDSITETLVLFGLREGGDYLGRLLLYVLNQDGQPLLPFNPLDTQIRDIVGNMIVGDLDRDGKGDILINNDWISQYTIINHLGEQLAGFPIYKDGLAGFFTAFADVDLDNKIEMTYYGKDYSQDPDRQKCHYIDLLTYNFEEGTLSSYPAFPKYMGYSSRPYNFAIADLDNDGKTELVSLTSYSESHHLFVFDLNSSLGSLDWPQYLHDEHHTGAWMPPTIPGDLNGDGDVNVQDIKILLKNWGEPLQSAADLNGDGVVNGLDFDQLLEFL